ncbi:hypothetical protein [Vibrio crassostreae]|uniref:hypothetical protein n=1 Tax=Vibrio crassostreae TaxID=246167 RepID=UPI001B30E57D|nr:hypothetical protein [Vibrio crassostreae]
MNELTPRTENVVVVEAKQYVHSEKREYSDEQLRQELFFKAHNKRQKDGRIYGLSPTGERVTMSINPHFEQFHTQVEEGVQPPVFALRDNGYYTVSSCEGHPFGGLIKVGFGTRSCRSTFIQKIVESGTPYISFREHDLCMNMKAVVSHKDAKLLKKTRFEMEGSEEYWAREQAKNFNMQFCTHFENWYFVDVLIFQPSEWYQPFKRRAERRDIIQKETVIQQLTDCIASMEHYSELYTRSFLDEQNTF